jgi:hypothetical protein
VFLDDRLDASDDCFFRSPVSHEVEALVAVAQVLVALHNLLLDQKSENTNMTLCQKNKPYKTSEGIKENVNP